MGLPSFPHDTKYELERLWAKFAELDRRRPRRPANLRDLQDINGWGAADGHSVFYDTATGRYKVALAPPFLKFNLNGTLSVSASDEDPMGAAGKLILVAARLKTSGSTTTTAILKHTTANGATTTSVATFSFTSGNKTPTTTPTVGFGFVADDYWWVDVTAAGTDAGGLVVAGWGTAA